jgi:hypothetical protein
MDILWSSPTDYVTGDPRLRLSYPFAGHPSMVVTAKSRGENMWVAMGLHLPPRVSIDEVSICYQVSQQRSCITAVRLSELDIPDYPIVRHLDTSPLNGTTSQCYRSTVNGFVPALAIVLELRLRFEHTKDRIMLGAVGIKIGPTANLHGNLRDFRAMGNNTDTKVFQAALEANNSVVVSQGAYFLDGLDIPRDTTLTLEPGAQLRLTAPITMNGYRSRLIGPEVGGLAYAGTGPNVPQVLWIGGENDSMLKIGKVLDPEFSSSPNGIVVRGLTMDAGGVGGMTGIDVGAAGVGSAWHTIADMSIVNAYVGIDIKQGNQQSTYERIHMMQFPMNAPPPVGSIGIHIGSERGGACTSLWFTRGTIQQYDTGIMISSAALKGGGGCAVCTIRDFVIENDPAGTGPAIDIYGDSGPYYIENNYFEGTNKGEICCFRIGDANCVPLHVTILRLARQKILRGEPTSTTAMRSKEMKDMISKVLGAL